MDRIITEHQQTNYPTGEVHSLIIKYHRDNHNDRDYYDISKIFRSTSINQLKTQIFLLKRYFSDQPYLVHFIAKKNSNFDIDPIYKKLCQSILLNNEIDVQHFVSFRNLFSGLITDSLKEYIETNIIDLGFINWMFEWPEIITNDDFDNFYNYVLYLFNESDSNFDSIPNNEIINQIDYFCEEYQDIKDRFYVCERTIYRPFVKSTFFIFKVYYNLMPIDEIELYLLQKFQEIGIEYEEREDLDKIHSDVKLLIDQIHYD